MGYDILQRNTTNPLRFLMVLAADHVTGAVGLVPVVTIAKASGGFAPPSGAVTEVGNGWYQVAPNPTDADTLGVLLLHATGAGADPVDDPFAVVTPTTAVTTLVPGSGLGNDTFRGVVGVVRLHVPAAPVFLIRHWINTAWKGLSRQRPWAFLRGQSALTITAARSVSVTVTNDSLFVTSAALFLTTDVGRQLRIGTIPTYTLVSRVDASLVQLDQPYGGTTGAATAQIFDGYALVPTDFGSFDLIADPYNQRRLAFWITTDQLNILDPTRQASDSGPRLLATASPSSVSATLGRLRYEYWPRPTAARSYPYSYFKQASDLAEGQRFAGVLADGGDILRIGALAQAAKWPGTAERPNPYFSLTLAAQLDAEFALGVQRLSLRDDDQQGQDLSRVHWERWPLADLAYNDQALRATDATLADLY